MTFILYKEHKNKTQVLSQGTQKPGKNKNSRWMRMIEETRLKIEYENNEMQ